MIHGSPTLLGIPWAPLIKQYRRLNVDPAPTLRALSQELKADLIVMGTVGRTGIPGFFIGNTAEELLQTSQASILAVKPTGFRSPVETA